METVQVSMVAGEGAGATAATGACSWNLEGWVWCQAAREAVLILP